MKDNSLSAEGPVSVSNVLTEFKAAYGLFCTHEGASYGSSGI